jgi:hypothetical protein
MLKIQKPIIASTVCTDKAQSSEPSEGDVEIFATEEEIKAHGCKFGGSAGNLSTVNTGSQKSQTGKWGKGTSGNPAGRPRGSRNKSTLIMEQLLADNAEQLMQKAIADALEGDRHAMNLCLRLFPRRTEPAISFELGPTDTFEQNKAAISNVLKAVASGQVPPYEAQAIMNMLHFNLDVVLGALYCK